MPMLDYKCAVCQHQFVELVTLGKEDQVRCEKCGSDQLVRVYQGKCLFGSIASHNSQNVCPADNRISCTGCQ